MLNVLYIAYHFPPSGGAGVQRSLKFVKYLPEFGIKPYVVTKDMGNTSDRELKDSTLMKEVPESVEVKRFDWPKREYKIAGKNELVRIVEKSKELIETNSIRAVFVSVSPFEDLEIASMISSKTNLPWIADLRDPWALDEFQTYKTFLHRRIGIKRMLRMLGSAKLVVMNTPQAERLLKETKGLPNSVVVSNVTNGYDKFDVDSCNKRIKNNKFTIVHTGHLHTKYGLRQVKMMRIDRILGRTINGVRFLPRSHYYLVKALEGWLLNQPSIKEQVTVKLIGSLTSEDRRIIEESKVADLFECPGYLEHGDSVSELVSADLLFLPMHAVGKGYRSSIVPGKTYEYLACKRPILAAVPEGDARDILKQAQTAYLCEPDDTKSIEKSMTAAFTNWKENKVEIESNDAYISKFERRALTESLASLIKHAINN